MPFEYTGCYFRFRFPDELVIDGTNLIAYTVGDYLLNALGNTDAVPIAKDLVSDEKYVIMEGCRYNFDQNVIQKFVEIKFANVKNPYASRATDYFKIDVWKTWDAT